ncbi:hypothetical protein TgHK011_000866 [Trichoderma gracile]|nr:hypothetical protein TgHK011_000866 [Trichoderma gracile]
MQLSKGEEGQAQSRRRANSCIGWHCLNSVTHFGIIFSIVVTFLILIPLTDDEHTNAIPRQRAWQDQYRLLLRSKCPSSTMQFLSKLRSPIYRPQEAPHPSHPGGMASGFPKAHEYQQEQAEPADNVFPSRQPTWWQRFYRAFTLPVGDASTVSSSSSPEPLETSQVADADIKLPTASPRSDGLKVRFDDQRERKELQLPVDDEDDVSSMLCNLNTSSDSLSSIRSDVATVHSDDFEMPRRRRIGGSSSWVNADNQPWKRKASKQPQRWSVRAVSSSTWKAGRARLLQPQRPAGASQANASLSASACKPPPQPLRLASLDSLFPLILSENGDSPPGALPALTLTYDPRHCGITDCAPQPPVAPEAQRPSRAHSGDTAPFSTAAQPPPGDIRTYRSLFESAAIMWNDEDNNPYGSSFDRRDSQTSSSAIPSSPTSRDYGVFETSHTPSTGSDDAHSPRAPFSHGVGHVAEEDVLTEDAPPRRKPGGYNSRIEQILYENPNMPIMITDAGKSVESGGRYIVYTIKTGDLEVRRRYSEFASLREALTRLHPTLVIPPIPEKHTMADYAANPTSAKQDQQIIDLRKRMLMVFLNRCRRMDAVREDGVWWRFLDPNSSWSEVLHSHPVASIPKSVLKAPPLDPANPTPAHNFLPIPSSSAKLKTPAGGQDLGASVFQGGSHAIERFPADASKLSEQELDPYFISYEASIKELEQLLTGPMEKVNRRTLSHLSSLAADLCELGSRYNAFALSEQAPSLGPAIERIGQAADASYIATEELSGTLGASFAEPMRENAQFAGVVRSVLRYRVLKRVQQDMTTEELNKKRALLDQLERSEAEARRIEQYLSNSQQISPPPKRSASVREAPTQHRRDGSQEDTESIDSDFPPTHGDFPKMPSTNSITNKIFGPIRHAVQGVVDVDPERTRRDTIGKTRESIIQLEQAQVVSEKDVKEASASVLEDLKRFQKDKEDDLRRYMLAYARSQIEWARKSKQQWEEARAEVDKIDEN